MAALLLCPNFLSLPPSSSSSSSFPREQRRNAYFCSSLALRIKRSKYSPFPAVSFNGSSISPLKLNFAHKLEEKYSSFSSLSFNGSSALEPLNPKVSQILRDTYSSFTVFSVNGSSSDEPSESSVFNGDSSSPIDDDELDQARHALEVAGVIISDEDLCTDSTRKPLKPIVIIGDPPTYVSAPRRRIVAVGDVHGDLDQTRHALQVAGVLSSDGEDLWIGGETVLVQLGDVLDRGEDEIAILSLLRSLDIQARAQGGAVFQINGNHETMNVEEDFRYVESGGYDECADFLAYLENCKYDWENAFLGWIGEAKQRKKNRKLSSQNYWDSFNLVKRQKGFSARSMLLKPGGPLALELARHPVVLKVNNWLFCHGGVLPEHVSYGIQKINREVSEWMKGHLQIPFFAIKGYDSVVWNRIYSRDLMYGLQPYQSKQVLSILEDTLEAAEATAMVVGHTPQEFGIDCKHNGGVWCIDVGMSRGMLNARPEVLEITGDKARVLKSRQDSFRELQVADYT